jgi:hypothetical protein
MAANPDTPEGGESQKSTGKKPRLRMTKKARAAARTRISSGTPKTMPSSRQRMRPGMNPTQNNPNDVGAKIIPQGTPSIL